MVLPKGGSVRLALSPSFGAGEVWGRVLSRSLKVEMRVALERAHGSSPAMPPPASLQP